MFLLRSIVPFLLLLLSFVGTAQTVQNDTSSGDSVLLGTEPVGEWQRDTTFYDDGDYGVTLKNDTIQYRRFFSFHKDEKCSRYFDIKTGSDEWWAYRRKHNKDVWKMDLREERMIDNNLLGDSMYVHYDLHYYNSLIPRTLHTLRIDYGDTTNRRYQSNDKTMAYFRWDRKNNEWNSYKKIVNEKISTENDTCFVVTVYKKHKNEWQPQYKREHRTVTYKGNPQANRKIYKWHKKWVLKYECFYGYGYGNPGLYFQKWNKSAKKYKVMKKYPRKKYYNLLMNSIY